MASLMGRQDPSQPVTASDKIMSKRHKERRKEIEKMADGPDKLKKSMIYNVKHRDEHQQALVKAKQDMKKLKLTVKFAKR